MPAKYQGSESISPELLAGLCLVSKSLARSLTGYEEESAVQGYHRHKMIQQNTTVCVRLFVMRETPRQVFNYKYMLKAHCLQLDVRLCYTQSCSDFPQRNNALEAKDLCWKDGSLYTDLHVCLNDLTNGGHPQNI